MKIKAILEQKPTVSFEVFPPKQWDKIEGTKAVVKEMVKSHPAFMSVTYGALRVPPAALQRRLQERSWTTV